MRASRLGATELAIFKIMRSKEAELQSTGAANLDACVRRTIAREARLAWKMRIEADDPLVRLDANEINTKINSLALADTDIPALQPRPFDGRH